jgi:hypothetical protein
VVISREVVVVVVVSLRHTVLHIIVSGVGGSVGRHQAGGRRVMPRDWRWSASVSRIQDDDDCPKVRRDG